MNSCLYTGHLTHARTRPVVHHFRYGVSLVYLDLDEIDAIGRSLRLFGSNCANVVSFHDRDHMDGQPGATKTKILAFLRAGGIELGDGRVFLLTQCRLFGYVFNPVSFYYCHDRDGALAAVVAEVNSTFGGRHLYLLEGGGGRYEAEKELHVSPFISMNARYQFRFSPVGELLSVHIGELEDGVHFFDAHLSVRRRPLSDRSLAAVLLRRPLETLKVIGAIHWEALRLWLKGAPFHPEPAPGATPRREELRA